MNENSASANGSSIAQLTLLLGMGVLFSAIGILIGASNTPVLGAVLTGFLGLVGTIATVLKVSDSSLLRTAQSMRTAGFSMIVVSVTLLTGVFVGETYRRLPYEPVSEFPWGDHGPPVGVHEALDWMLLADELDARGYDRTVVTSLYSIRVIEQERLGELIKAELDEYEFASTELYDCSSPYSSMLANAVTRRVGAQRGPASTDP